MNPSRGILLCLLVCLILCGIIFGIFMLIWAPHVMPVKDISFSRCSVIQEEQTIILSGYFTKEVSNSFSTTTYRGFSYDLVDNDLYIKIKGGLVSPRHRFADFSIRIPVDNLQEINRIYHTDGKERQLIYKLR